MNDEQSLWILIPTHCPQPKSLLKSNMGSVQKPFCAQASAIPQPASHAH